MAGADVDIQSVSFRTAILAGVRYLLEAQYGNGGWPQYHPLRNDYSRQVTFNDDAIVHVMELLRDIAAGRPPFAWIDSPIRTRAAQAVELGVKMILAAQIQTKGTRTAWCAQHDAISLLPCAARSYELPSVSGLESIGIVRFLILAHDRKRVLQVGFHPIQRFSLSETICPAPISFRSDGFISKDR